MSAAMLFTMSYARVGGSAALFSFCFAAKTLLTRRMQRAVMRYVM